MQRVFERLEEFQRIWVDYSDIEKKMVKTFTYLGVVFTDRWNFIFLYYAHL